MIPYTEVVVVRDTTRAFEALGTLHSALCTLKSADCIQNPKANQSAGSVISEEPMAGGSLDASPASQPAASRNDDDLQGAKHIRRDWGRRGTDERAASSLVRIFSSSHFCLLPCEA